MATSMDMFRKLGLGLKFDLKRFKNDAEKFQVLKSPAKEASEQELSRALDIFGAGKKSLSAPKVRPDDGRDAAAETPAKGRKRKPDDRPSLKKPVGKSRKKQRRGGGSDDETATVEDGGGVQLMASSLQTSQKKKPEKAQLSTEKLLQMQQEQVNAFRRQHKIHVRGTDIPNPVGTFHELQEEYKLHSDIIENIHRAGFVEPTQIQMQAVPIMLHRRELLACAPTGSGKTAAFILPILAHLKEPRNRGFRAVVLSPTRELANQTYNEFRRLGEGLGLRTHVIETAAKAAKQFGPESSQRFDILVTTPNRLVYLLNQDPPAIKLHNVEWLVVDESDKLFEDGKSGFRDQLATIYRACDSAQVRRAMFSATFAYDVEQWCKLNLDNVVTVTIGQRNTATELIQQELVFVGGEYGKLLAVRDIFRKGFKPPILVFVQSKERAKELYHELIYDGYNVDVIHSDKTQTQRDNIVKCFRSGKIWVLIATELMGRGIDFKGIHLVLNYDFPTSAISYIHRIGRTGRAGRPGRAVTFFTEDDAVYLRSIANVMRNAGCPVPDYMLELKKLPKRKRKKLEQKPVKRETIRTLPKQDLEKAKRKKQIIKKAMKDNQKDQSRQGSEVTQEQPQKADGVKKTKTKAGKGSKVDLHPTAAKKITVVKKPATNKGKTSPAKADRQSKNAQPKPTMKKAKRPKAENGAS